MTTEPIDWNDRDHLVVVNTETGERWKGNTHPRCCPDSDGYYFIYFSDDNGYYFKPDGTTRYGDPYRIENGTVDQRPDDIPQSAWDAAEGRSREDVARMMMENPRLRKAADDLLPYTSHSVGCAIYQQSWAGGSPDCTCGCDRVRAAYRAGREKQK